MNNNSEPGFLNKLSGMFSNATKAVTGNNTRKNGNNVKKNQVMPATAGVNAPTNASPQPNATAPQMGGVAPLNFRYPANMQQPSEAVMRWATTAGMPAPANMRGVAQGGGKRRTKRRRTKRRSTKRRTHMRKSYKKVKGGKRRSMRRSKSHSKRRN